MEMQEGCHVDLWAVTRLREGAAGRLWPRALRGCNSVGEREVAVAAAGTGDRSSAEL